METSEMYEAPDILTIEVKVEQGFQKSGDETDGIGDGVGDKTW